MCLQRGAGQLIHIQPVKAVNVFISPLPWTREGSEQHRLCMCLCVYETERERERELKSRMVNEEAATLLISRVVIFRLKLTVL